MEFQKKTNPNNVWGGFRGKIEMISLWKHWESDNEKKKQKKAIVVC